jgi:hypothetical protein
MSALSTFKGGGLHGSVASTLLACIDAGFEQSLTGC